MANRLLLTIFFAFGVSIHAFAAFLTFDWNGSSTNWASSGSWNETGGTGDYPGSGSRTTDIVRFGVTGSSYSRMPVLTASLTVASIEFGGTIVSSGTKLTVNTNTLTVGSITQDMNTLNNSGTFDYLQGTGTITCTGNINVGAGTSSSGNNNYMLSDIATLNVLGNVNIVANVNLQNGSGFRLEAGNMYLSGIISFTTNSRVTASNACYFTINTITQATPQVATTPYLYFLNASPIGTIPTPYASVNLYGDHGGTGTVTYTAADPQITTTSTPGFGSGGANIDTSKASYDNLVIQATGIAKIGGSTVGALKVAGDFNTNSPVTFSPAGASATNTSVGGNWNNTSTVTGGVGSTAIIGNITNSGAMTLSSGILQVGGNVSNSSTIAAGTGSITIDGSLSNTNTLTLSSGALKVAGNYTNSATFTAGSGTVYFNGALAQSLADNSTSGTTFNNVDFSGGGTKTLSGTGSFAVSTIGVLTMQASNILQTGGILTLNSASTGSATVAAIPSNSSITGNVNVQRYISGGSNSYRGYRFLSSAIYTVKSGSNYYYDLSYLPNFAPVTGSLASGGVTKTGNPTIYLYRDDEAFTNKTFNTGNFRGVNKINNNPLYQVGVDYDGTFALHAGTGFLFFYRGNLTNISTKYLSTTVAEANVFVSTGVLNQQAVTVTNWVTGLTTLQFSAVPGNTGYSGYNLVGNPYASSIDWNT
ncbi:MAG: trimeric autotransporter adhesin, partial [Mucilaginibacter sp.]|nr:trimeric autotransporter adhesin [Mucilaginibacter sp.]